MEKPDSGIREFASALSRILHLPDLFFSKDDAGHILTSLLFPLLLGSSEDYKQAELTDLFRDAICAFSAVVREKKLYRNSKNDPWPEAFLTFVQTFQMACEKTGMSKYSLFIAFLALNS